MTPVKLWIHDCGKKTSLRDDSPAAVLTDCDMNQQDTSDNLEAAHIAEPEADALARSLAAGLTAFLSADASADWGGGLVFVRAGSARGPGRLAVGRLDVVPRSASLYLPLLLSEARGTYKV